MACKQENSFSIEFPQQGIEVAVVEADVRDKRRHFSVGEFRLQRPAGELIAESVPSDVPALIKIGGNLSRRMMYDGESLTFERKMNGDEVADLRLNDPTKILQYGSVSRNFQMTTLDVIVEYIMAQVEDPNNVIRGTAFVQGSNAGDLHFIGAGGSAGIALPAGVEGSDTQIPYIGEALDFINNLDDMLEEKLFGDTYTGIEMRNQSPLEALDEICEQFELDYWVGADGILKIGLDGTTGQTVGVVDGDDSLKLQRYAITSDPEKVNSVYLEGPYLQLNTGTSFIRNNKPRQHELKLMVEAKDPATDGHTITGKAQRGIEDLEELENAAKRRLVREMMDRANGSVEVNALASEDKETIAQLKVGDVITLDDGLNVRCDKNLITGPFLIQGIDHKANPRQGWSVSLDVARIPHLSQIEVDSVVYDPLEDKKYDSLEEYRDSFEDDTSMIGIAP